MAAPWNPTCLGKVSILLEKLKIVNGGSFRYLLKPYKEEWDAGIIALEAGELSFHYMYHHSNSHPETRFRPRNFASTLATRTRPVQDSE